MKNLDKDHQTVIENLKNKVAEFCNQRNWDIAHNPKDLAVGAVTEASELLEIFRFCSEEKSLQMIEDKQIKERMGEELADIFYFLLRFAQLYKFDLTDCLESKLTKNALKYPVNNKT